MSSMQYFLYIDLPFKISGFIRNGFNPSPPFPSITRLLLANLYDIEYAIR